MKKTYQYKCTLLSDVILTSMANTEGYKESLNYISGSKFLGIVAKKLYKEHNAQKILDIFHNGTVHFGDATPIIEGNATLKVPFSWFHEKGKGLADSISLHHNIEASATDVTIQLKQARQGYFSVEKKYFTTVEQDFSIKSAYDGVSRKSKDENMYGYFSLKKGTSWAFSVEDIDGQYADSIKNILLGRHTIGKSKSAEYGLVQIEFLSEKTEIAKQEYKNELLIYAQSNLCFYDNFGKSTALPTVEQLVGVGQPNAEINWAKSQVRSRNYQTWNGKRNNRDADRLIIESGSVFFVELKESINSSFFINGIGSHKNEGFGSVMINPDFLMSMTGNLEKVELDISSNYTYKGSLEDDLVLQCLENRQKRNDFDYTIDKKVNRFIKDNYDVFKGISNSQWGALRNYAKHSINVDTFEILAFSETVGFLKRGKSEIEWRKYGRRDKLKNYLDNLLEDKKPHEYLPFVVKLSTQMAKIKQNGH